LLIGLVVRALLHRGGHNGRRLRRWFHHRLADDLCDRLRAALDDRFRFGRRNRFHHRLVLSRRLRAPFRALREMLKIAADEIQPFAAIDLIGAPPAATAPATTAAAAIAIFALHIGGGFGARLARRGGSCGCVAVLAARAPAATAATTTTTAVFVGFRVREREALGFGVGFFLFFLLNLIGDFRFFIDCRFAALRRTRFRLGNV